MLWQHYRVKRTDVSILVVDDVGAVRTQIVNLLELLGFTRVKVAETGPAAVALFDAQPFNLVLADWHMTPVGGFDLLLYVRTFGSRKDTPFIMITAERKKERVMAAINSGVDGYITKPITAGELESKILSVLSRKGVLG